jgi:hypothetical protein
MRYFLARERNGPHEEQTLDPRRGKLDHQGKTIQPDADFRNRPGLGGIEDGITTRRLCSRHEQRDRLDRGTLVGRGQLCKIR